MIQESRIIKIYKSIRKLYRQVHNELTNAILILSKACFFGTKMVTIREKDFDGKKFRVEY